MNYEEICCDHLYSDHVVNVSELFDALQEKYGDLDDDCGCYIGSEWLSVKQIVETVMMFAYRE